MLVGTFTQEDQLKEVPQSWEGGKLITSTANPPVFSGRDCLQQMATLHTSEAKLPF